MARQNVERHKTHAARAERPQPNLSAGRGGDQISNEEGSSQDGAAINQ
jgi:hypothetical protein